MTQVWQACPVCRGTGLVSRPPGVAGDQESWVSSSIGPYSCRPCEGKGILLSPDAARSDDPFDGLGDAVKDAWGLAVKFFGKPKS